MRAKARTITFRGGEKLRLPLYRQNADIRIRVVQGLHLVDFERAVDLVPSALRRAGNFVASTDFDIAWAASGKGRLIGRPISRDGVETLLLHLEPEIRAGHVQLRVNGVVIGVEVFELADETLD